MCDGVEFYKTGSAAYIFEANYESDLRYACFSKEARMFCYLFILSKLNDPEC